MKPSIIYEDCGKIPYAHALARQTAAFETLLTAKQEGLRAENHLFICEHEPVITLGKRADERNILLPEAVLKQRGFNIFRTDRGGDVTCHGPGQLTVYPVIDLEQWGIGLRQYINHIEELIIDFLRQYAIKGYRLNRAAGVWVGESPRKICAVGVRSSRFVVMHGFALNINTSLDAFSLVNPCGFVDKGVTSLAAELGAEQDMDKAKEQLLVSLKKIFG